MALHKNFKILAWFNFFTDFRFFAPIAVLYFQKVTGSFGLGMSVFSVIFISQAIMEVPTGVFSDKIGRKNTMILGALCNVLTMIFWAIGGSYIMLAIGAFFQGLGRSFYSGTYEALVHGTLSKTHQAHEYHMYSGKLSSLFQIASAGAAIVGGFVAAYSYTFVMWISVIPQLLCLLLSLCLIEPKLKKEETGNIFVHTIDAFKLIIKNRKLRLLAVADMVGFGMGEANYEFQAAFYALVWPTWALGIARTISGVAAAVSFYFAGKIINRFSAIKAILFESIATPLIKIGATVFITVASPVFMALTSLFYGSGSTAANLLQQKEFTNAQRATMASLISLAGSLFYAFSAYLLGILADAYGVKFTIIFGQVVTMTLIFFYVRIYKRELKSPTSQT